MSISIHGSGADSELNASLTTEQRRRDTRRILWQWGDTLAYCRRKQSEVREFSRLIDDAAYTVGAQFIDDMPRPPSPSGDGTFRAMEEMQRNRALYEAARQQCIADIRQALSLKAAIDRLIDELPPIQQRVVQLRYESGHKYEFIAMSLSYDVSRIKSFESQAIDTTSEWIRVNELKTN